MSRPASKWGRREWSAPTPVNVVGLAPYADAPTGSAGGCSPATTGSMPPPSSGCSPGWKPATAKGEVGAAYLAKELLRETYLARNPLEACRRLVAFYAHGARSEVPELESLGHTIARWGDIDPALAPDPAHQRRYRRHQPGHQEHQAARLRVPQLWTPIASGAFSAAVPQWRQHRPVASMRPRQPRTGA
jgi:hypothetical protein